MAKNQKYEIKLQADENEKYLLHQCPALLEPTPATATVHKGGTVVIRLNGTLWSTLGPVVSPRFAHGGSAYAVLWQGGMSGVKSVQFCPLDETSETESGEFVVKTRGSMMTLYLPKELMQDLRNRAKQLLRERELSDERGRRSMQRRTYEADFLKELEQSVVRLLDSEEDDVVVEAARQYVQARAEFKRARQVAQLRWPEDAAVPAMQGNEFTDLAARLMVSEEVPQKLEWKLKFEVTGQESKTLTSRK